MKLDENPKALKHKLGKNHFIRMNEAISPIYPEFDKKLFLKYHISLENLTLKERVSKIRDILYELLPKNYNEAISILLKTSTSTKLEDFDLWPITDYIQFYGQNHKELSLKSLKELTKLFTSEWAIRPFLINDTQKTLSFLIQCSIDQNKHVRRWASEGSRPRLPWGEQLKSFIKDPSLTLPILENLKFDDELYVRKSVANHLNDISKDHPNILFELLNKWKKEVNSEEKKEKLNWIIRHSLRNLIKEGNPTALSFLDVSTKFDIHIESIFFNSDKIYMGKNLEFSFIISSKMKKQQNLVIDYRIHFLRDKGKSSIKVFKLKNISISPSDRITITKKHLFKEISTRKYYNGDHKIDIQINGKVIKSKTFKIFGANHLKK